MIEGVAAFSVSHDRRRERHSNDRRQEPVGTNDKRSRQSEINSSNCKHSQYRLPPRFGLIDVSAALRHRFDITQAAAARIRVIGFTPLFFAKKTNRSSEHGKMGSSVRVVKPN